MSTYILPTIPALILGLIIGLGYSRVVVRFMEQLPLRKPLFGPVTHCHHCHTDAPLVARLPILGFLLAKGRCTECQAPRRRRIPITELLLTTAAVWLFISFPLVSALLHLFMIGVLWAIGWIDYEHWVIPNLLVGLIAIGAVGAVLTGHPDLEQALWGLGSVTLYLGIIMLIHFGLFRNPGLGWGDFKLSIALSLWLGPFLSLFTFFSATAIAMLFWVAIGWRLGFDRRRPLQFGPFIAAAALVFALARVLDPQVVNHLLLPQ